MFKNKIENTGADQTKNSVVSVWIPLANRKIQEMQGKSVPEIVSIPLPVVEKERNYLIPIVFLVFFMVLIYLWIKVRSLQNQLNEITEILNKMR